MHKHIKSLAVTAAVGVLGLLLASTAQAAVTTNLWVKANKTGDWNTASNWTNTKVPTETSVVRFDSGDPITVNCNMSIAKVAGILKQAAGTTTLNNIPSSFTFGPLTQSNGGLVFNWKGEAPTNPLSAINIKGGSVVDLGGATQTLSSMPNITDGKAFTINNATLITGWSASKKPGALTVGENATWKLTGNFTHDKDDYTQTLNVNGGLFDCQAKNAWLGEYGSGRKHTLNLSNGGQFVVTNGTVHLGYSGVATVSIDNATFDAHGKTLNCAKTHTSSYTRTYNGIAKITMENGAVLKAGAIDYGMDVSGKNPGFFTLTANNSTLYIGSLKASGAATNTTQFTGATIVPCASSKEFLIQGHANVVRNYIKLVGDGLTIDNRNKNNVTIDQRLAGDQGLFTAKMYGADFTLKTYISTTGKVTFENPGVIALECEQQAFPENSTVAINFTEAPMSAAEHGRSLITWAVGMRPENVTFALDSKTAEDYELQESETGISIQRIGYAPAATAEWIGGDDRDANATTNWVYKDAAGKVLKNGYKVNETIYVYGGGNPKFDVTNGADIAGHVFLITRDVTLPATRDWSGFDTIALADGVTINENGYKLKLGGNLMGTNDNATVSNGGDLDFTIPTGDEKLLGPITLNSVTNIFKRGPGTLTATNLTLTGTAPVLTLTGGTMAFDWSGQDLGTNFLAGITASSSTTLDLGGGRQTVEGVPLKEKASLTLKNGTLITDWIAANAGDGDRTIKAVGAGAEWIVNGGLRAEQAEHKAYVTDGGVLTVKGASILGDWYNTRSFKIYVADGTLNHNEGDLTIGSTGVGLVDLENSTLNAEGRTIKASVKTKKSGKGEYNGDATLTLDKKAVLKAKAITYGDDEGTIHKDNTAFTFKATGYSTLYIESLTAAGGTKDEITFSAATIVPMKSGVLIKGSTNLTSNVINIGRGGLTIDNQYTNTVTISETLKDLYADSGAVTFNLYGADLTITEPQLSKNIKFVNPGRIYLTGEKTTFAENTTVTIDYTDASFIKRSKIITWDAKQPATLKAELTERGQQLSGRKLIVYPQGISFKTGFTLILR